MAIPTELTFENEDDFVQRFLIPLLQRMGFSVVANYHGSTEFGKDLIFAEVDRFGHVRYHGLQAKYVDSISQAASHELVRDCNEAFGNPFRHPQTGAEGRISSFYAVNAGSISDQAKTNYFNQLRGRYGDNALLLEAKDLLVLDRWAAAGRRDAIVESLAGLRIELEFNRKRIVPSTKKSMQSYVDEGGRGVGIAIRFRTAASSSYLQQPFLADQIGVDDVMKYCSCVDTINKKSDFIVHGLELENRAEVGASALKDIEYIEAVCEQLLARIDETLASLGPNRSIGHESPTCASPPSSTV